MITDMEYMRHDAEALLDVLQKAGKPFRITRRGQSRIDMTCPFHEDKHASAGIFSDEDGVYRFKCHGCGVSGDIWDIRAMLENRTVKDVLKEVREQDRTPPKPPKPVLTIEGLRERYAGLLETEHPYTNPATGQVDFLVLRCRKDGGKKFFVQCRPVAGGFVQETVPDPKPIYNRIRLGDAESVVVVEGEKCVHVLQAVGVVATTSPGGAGKARHADWGMLAGKTVYLWPDNDDNGIPHMQDVEAILRGLRPRPRVFWIEYDQLDLPAKGDVADYLARFADVGAAGKRRAVENVLESALPTGEEAELDDWVQDVVAGKKRSMSWPWKCATLLSKSLRPETVTILCGDPGAGKTFMGLQAAVYWHKAGLHVAVYEVEDRRTAHQKRVLAQVAGDHNLADAEDWGADNPELFLEAIDAYRDLLHGIGRRITTVSAEETVLTLDTIADWAAREADEGAEIVLIDSVTAVGAAEKAWVTDSRFVNRLKKEVVEKHGVRAILVMHPKKGRKGAIGMEELAGGASFSRLAHTILWLERCMPAKEFTVASAVGPIEVETNRVLKILKARNGRGAGADIAMHFDKQTLTFSELGVIERRK